MLSRMLAGFVAVAALALALPADAAAAREHSLHQIDTSFFIVAGLIAALTVFIFLVRKSLAAGDAAEAEGGDNRVIAALRSPWALFGGLAIFLSVGAEVSIGSMMINFLHQPDVMGVTLEEPMRPATPDWPSRSRDSCARCRGMRRAGRFTCRRMSSWKQGRRAKRFSPAT